MARQTDTDILILIWIDKTEKSRDTEDRQHGVTAGGEARYV